MPSPHLIRLVRGESVKVTFEDHDGDSIDVVYDEDGDIFIAATGDVQLLGKEQ